MDSNGWLALIRRCYDGLIFGLLYVASAMLAAFALAIAYDVVLRTLGLQAPMWTSALTEYALLYYTMMVAPWLARTGGHVNIDSVVRAVGPAARARMEKGAFLACILISLMLAWFSGKIAFDYFISGEIDVRSIRLPRWVLFVSMPPAFILVAIEFVCALARHGGDGKPAGSH